jgi:hypothetical protein
MVAVIHLLVFAFNIVCFGIECACIFDSAGSPDRRGIAAAFALMNVIFAAEAWVKL